MLSKNPDTQKNKLYDSIYKKRPEKGNSIQTESTSAVARDWQKGRIGSNWLLFGGDGNVKLAVVMAIKRWENH